MLARLFFGALWVICCALPVCSQSLEIVNEVVRMKKAGAVAQFGVSEEAAEMHIRATMAAFCGERINRQKRSEEAKLYQEMMMQLAQARLFAEMAIVQGRALMEERKAGVPGTPITLQFAEKINE